MEGNTKRTPKGEEEDLSEIKSVMQGRENGLGEEGATETQSLLK